MILLEQQTELDKKLCGYIKELAKKPHDGETIRIYAFHLRDLYAIEDYRHSYSRFFPVIGEIHKDKTSSVEYLMDNLRALVMAVETDNLKNVGKEFGKLYTPLRKLSDHINLEIARYLNYKEKDERASMLETQLELATNTLETAKKELDDTNKKISTAKKELDDTNKKINSIQSELIAVLSIFAAIVMGFSGSLNFLGNTLAQNSQLPFTKQLLVIFLCGLILINFIFAMMYFVAKITGRNIYARCETLDCTCKDGKMPKCNGFTRIMKRLPYIFWLNIVIFILIILNVLIIIF